ncbi:unnamed protein product [Vitrella brassicaformis CCMP3155]|uniref:Uncharacterized protein n=3 Tax=Vitrella brassicaformis TaxID=1169539 RepID=A0A0G4FK86_VITBC|nr:unnamed protein product [Vitrella brassicaformis CCMP3155]|eukprot:CEM13794.1 unnamed protein product [Vitrella brassicaformis CCMP3155]
MKRYTSLEAIGLGEFPPGHQEDGSGEEDHNHTRAPGLPVPSRQQRQHRMEEEHRATAMRQEAEKASQEEVARMQDRQQATEKQLRAARLHERHLKSKISRQAEDILDKATEIDQLRKRTSKRTSDDTRPGRLAGVLMASPHRLEPLSDSRHRPADEADDEEEFEDVHFLPHPVHPSRHQRSPSLPPPGLPKLNLKEVHEERDRNYPRDQVAAAAAGAAQPAGVGGAAGKGGSSSGSSGGDGKNGDGDVGALAAPSTHKRQDTTDRQEGDDGHVGAAGDGVNGGTARFYKRKYALIKSQHDSLKDIYHMQEQSITSLREQLKAIDDDKAKVLAAKDEAAAKAADEWFKLEHVLRTTIGKQQRELDIAKGKLQEAERHKLNDAEEEPLGLGQVIKEEYEALKARLKALQDNYAKLTEEKESLEKAAAANADLDGGQDDIPTDDDLAHLLSDCALPPEVTAVVRRVDETLDREQVRADRLAEEAANLRKMAEQQVYTHAADTQTAGRQELTKMQEDQLSHTGDYSAMLNVNNAMQEVARRSQDDERSTWLQQMAALQSERDSLQRENEGLEHDRAELIRVIRACEQHLKAAAYLSHDHKGFRLPTRPGKAPPVPPTIPAGGVPVAGAARVVSDKSQILGRAMRGGASRGEGRWPSAGGSHFTNGRRQQQASTSGGRGASIGAVLGHKASPAAAISTSPGARVASRADGVSVDGRIATPPTDAHTDVTARATKQRAADTTDDSNMAAATVAKKTSKQRSVTASAAGRRKRPSPPQTADGAVGVERGHGGENAAMIGPGVGIRTGGGRGDRLAAVAGMMRASDTEALRPFTAPTESDAPKTLAFTQDHRQKTAPVVKRAYGPRLSIVMTRIANEPPSFDVAKTRLPVVGEGADVDLEADRVGARLWNGKGTPPVVHHTFAEHHVHHPKCGPLTPANALKLKLQQAQTPSGWDTDKRAVGVLMSGHRHSSSHRLLSPPPFDAHGASSATMPRRVPDLRLPATLSSQSRHHHQRQQQRFPPTAAPQPPHVMHAFAPPPRPPYATIGQPIFGALQPHMVMMATHTGGPTAL